MPTKGEIKSGKILIKDVFKMWFHVPEYQRPYVWGYEEINDLLDDLTFAMSEKPDSEYFLGSIVFQSKPADLELGRKFPENDLLDGQQRMITLLLLLAVIRDLVETPQIKKKCQEYIYQEADPIENIPERTRLVFSIRDAAQEFFDEYLKTEGCTNDKVGLERTAEKVADISVQNMSKAVLEIRKYF